MATYIFIIGIFIIIEIIFFTVYFYIDRNESLKLMQAIRDERNLEKKEIKEIKIEFDNIIEKKISKLLDKNLIDIKNLLEKEGKKEIRNKFGEIVRKEVNEIITQNNAKRMRNLLEKEIIDIILKHSDPIKNISIPKFMESYSDYKSGDLGLKSGGMRGKHKLNFKDSK